MTYKEVFPYIKNNKVWSGRTEWAGGMWFETKDKTDVDKTINGVPMKNVPSIWMTNMEHGRRHEKIRLMSMSDNLRYSKHLDLRKYGYIKYDNYDAIDVPYVDIIPSDYNGIMGTPATFLDKYCPEQFEIIGIGTGDSAKELGVKKNYRGRSDLSFTHPETGKPSCPFSRILIRKKQ